LPPPQNWLCLVIGVCLLLTGQPCARAAGGSSLATWLPAVQWTPPALPVQFRFGGNDSADFLHRCQLTQEQPAVTNPSLRRLHWDDPVTKLRLTAEIQTLEGFDALTWVLFFENRGHQDTPILEDIRAGAFALPAP